VTNFFKRIFKLVPKPYPELALLEQRLDYKFRDRAFLFHALCHRSYVNSQKGDSKLPSNERLEFLGDSVLNTLITVHLFHRYPQHEEGRLSKMKSLVVSAKVLALCAETWELGRFLQLSRSEEKSGGRQRPSILADAYEAVLGAVFLDGGFVPAKKLVTASVIAIMDEVLADEELANYKSQLLEFTQGKGLGAPAYEVQSESGPEHQKTFVILVKVQGKVWGKGSGTSKKAAEQAGARAALEAQSGVEPASLAQETNS
jgi:ribonuclease-3